MFMDVCFFALSPSVYVQFTWESVYVSWVNPNPYLHMD